MGVAAVGFLLIRGVAGVPIFDDDPGQFFLLVSCYLLGVAVLALMATEVMRLLLLTNTPRPRVFFGWISAVVIVAAFLLPLVTQQPFAERFGLAFINLITTVVIAVLEGVSAAAVSDEPLRPGHIEPPNPIDRR